MSKSKGNTVYPEPIVKRYGSDALRYYLMREMPFGADGNYTNEALLTRINSDLANDLGNLVSRTVAMIEKYFDGVIPLPEEPTGFDDELKSRCESLWRVVEKSMNELQFSVALSEIWKLVSDCNRYIDLTRPWVLGKNPEDAPKLKTVLYYLAECVRVIAVLIGPTMPRTPERIFEQLGLKDDGLKTWDSIKTFGLIPEGVKVCKAQPLFPRIDIPKELEELAGDKKEQPQKIEDKPEKKKDEGEKAEENKYISFDDFSKVKLVTARVIACERVENTDKLLKETLELKKGDIRTVVSGIAKYYSPEDMVGKTVILVENLAPRKMRGIVSQGMLLCASNPDGELRLLTAEDLAQGGWEIG